ncbi:hypothetical protein NM208_g1939 [Fusarium decemcellulare]|uniref:Uncharacterized protein n=1 Tax=Fusarium decemcellulare TaxID=57161 RepID=A0ACC1SUN6_9HYPO|nr:hypothetical protein NM208_g1939 [Fusarium decemcellulare]
MAEHDKASKRPIKIASISGYSDDRRDALANVLDGPIEVDAIVGDYLAEMNLSWRKAEMDVDASKGYDQSFISSLHTAKVQLGRRLDAGTFPKILVNAGALNPKQLAVQVRGFLTSVLGDAGALLQLAYVTGDNVTDILGDQTAKRAIKNLNTGETLDIWPHEAVIANAYIGQSGLVAALRAGADIILAGRTTDASTVQALGSWWFNWEPSEYDNHALGLVTGHLIECGNYVTGGNFCGFKSVKPYYKLGYPIAEIYGDGHSIITKQPNQNGLVHVDTVRSQLMYEIQGRYYFNPDVIADLSSVSVEKEGPERVRISGFKGLPPPPTLKVAIQAVAGYQAEMLVYAMGLDIEEKAQALEEQLRQDILSVGDEGQQLRKLEVQLFGTAKRDPSSSDAATAVIRIFAQAGTAEALTTFNLQRRVMQNLGQSFPGFTPNLEYHRTTVPRPHFTYFPGLISRSEVETKVHWEGRDTVEHVPVDHANFSVLDDVQQENYEPTQPADLSRFGPTIRVPLGHKVFARSGDKGSNANIGFFQQDDTQEGWDWLRTFLSTKRVLELLGKEAKTVSRVERVEFPKIRCVHFVLLDYIGGSGSDGIGAKVTAQLLHAGALVVVADVKDAQGQRLVNTLTETNAGHQKVSIVYKYVDVSDYESVLALFKHAIDLHGRVDLAIHCAGITEIKGWFDPEATMDSIYKPPTSKVLDVNLNGTFYFTQVALVALQHGRQEADVDKSVTLISSIAGFKESPGLFMYSASKHGVMGLMRSLRGYLPSAFNVRLNAVCPWATDTAMFGHMRDAWVREDLPLNSPEEVARIIVQCATDKGIHGKAVYVAGGRGFDIEEGINRSEPLWMGEKQAEDLARGQEFLATGSRWVEKE